jgi:hypothetical protein
LVVFDLWVGGRFLGQVQIDGLALTLIDRIAVSFLSILRAVGRQDRGQQALGTPANRWGLLAIKIDKKADRTDGKVWLEG